MGNGVSFCVPPARKGLSSLSSSLPALFFLPFPRFSYRCFDVFYHHSPAKGKKNCVRKQHCQVGAFITFAPAGGLRAPSGDCRLRAGSGARVRHRRPEVSAPRPLVCGGRGRQPQQWAGAQVTRSELWCRKQMTLSDSSHPSPQHCPYPSVRTAVTPEL